MNEKIRLSVIIPVYNYATHLKKTLKSIKDQTFSEFEIIVIDDKSTDNSIEIANQYADRVYMNKKNSGPAVSRNKGIKLAKGEIVVFIDSDCIATKDWLNNIVKAFNETKIDGIMGNTKIPKSTFLGDSISALGFPGGANAGFENMWHVDKKGFTDHITSCNFAARKKTFFEHGFFDESFPLAGGEDSELSYRWSKRGVKLKYLKDLLIYHEPRKKLDSFIRWMIYRGRSNYYFKQKVGNINNFIKLRIWSSKNIVKKFIFDPKIILIIPLLFLSFILQKYGYYIESKKKSYGNEISSS